MPRARRPFLAVALFAVASFARGDALRLLAPAEGATLRGGSFAELRWSAAQLPGSAEEWEAFLSIDGGKYYAFRVTPHLDIELRRFTFVVPNVDTRNARILIRTGNEVRETLFEIRGAFAIVRDRGADQPVHSLLQFGRAEAAREGDPAVLSWADGTRNGAGITHESSAIVPSASLGRPTTATGEAPVVITPAENSIAAPSNASTRQSACGAHARTSETLPRSVDLLLVCRRRNI